MQLHNTQNLPRNDKKQITIVLKICPIFVAKNNNFNFLKTIY